MDLPKPEPNFSENMILLLLDIDGCIGLLDQNVDPQESDEFKGSFDIVVGQKRSSFSNRVSIGRFLAEAHSYGYVIVLWTSQTQQYANAIVNQLNQRFRFSFQLFAFSAQEFWVSGRQVSSNGLRKDVDLLLRSRRFCSEEELEGFALSSGRNRIVIVDDSDVYESYWKQYQLMIRSCRAKGSPKKDNTLIRTIGWLRDISVRMNAANENESILEGEKENIHMNVKHVIRRIGKEQQEKKIVKKQEIDAQMKSLQRKLDQFQIEDSFVKTPQ